LQIAKSRATKHVNVKTGHPAAAEADTAVAVVADAVVAAAAVDAAAAVAATNRVAAVVVAADVVVVTKRLSFTKQQKLSEDASYSAF
jgi:hypothetical protein